MDLFTLNVGDSVYVVREDKTVSEGTINTFACKSEYSAAITVNDETFEVDRWGKKVIIVNKPVFESEMLEKVANDYFNVLDKKFGVLMKDMSADKINLIVSKLQEIDEVMESSIKSDDSAIRRRIAMMQNMWGNHCFTIKDIYQSYATKMMSSHIDMFRTYVAQTLKKVSGKK